MKRTYLLDTRTNTLYNYHNAIEVEMKYCREDLSFEEWVNDDYPTDRLLAHFKKYESVEDAIDDLKQEYEEWVYNEAHNQIDNCFGDWTAYEVDD